MNFTESNTRNMNMIEFSIPCHMCVVKPICINKHVRDLFEDCGDLHKYVVYDCQDRPETGRRVDRMNEELKRAFKFETEVMPLIPNDQNPADGPSHEYFIIIDQENGTDCVFHQMYHAHMGQQ